MTDVRHALVTNDDGIDAVGLRVLAEAAADAGWSVTVAAPGWDSSGASASFTAVETGHGIAASPRDGYGAPGTTAFAVEASPAYIVRAGIAGAFGPRPDVVLSGVNHGANLGHAILHSGTVGAALTAASFDVPALAVSLASIGPTPGWETVRLVLARILPTFPTAGVRVVNLNVPDVDPHQLRGIEHASLAPFGAVQVTNTERDGDRIRLTYSRWRADEPGGCDAALLRRGFATITAVDPVCEGSADLADLLLAAAETSS